MKIPVKLKVLVVIKKNVDNSIETTERKTPQIRQQRKTTMRQKSGPDRADWKITRGSGADNGYILSSICAASDTNVNIGYC